MLFHEIYGAYFRTVARLLQEAGNAGISDKRMMEIISEHAFAESVLVIPDKLRSGEWPLLKVREDPASGQKVFTSVLKHRPERPLTLLEKQWLKSIISDPRIRLFLYREEDISDLEEAEKLLSDVQPLYDLEMFEYYDRFADGDDYRDPAYVQHFHTVLQAIHEKRMIFAEYTGNRRRSSKRLYFPYGIEYSSKDDKFRVLCRTVKGIPYTINISRIGWCEIRRKASPEEMELSEIRKTYVDLELTDERNALQRAMLHFSDLQKETEKADGKHYKIRLYYYRDDETEIVIRILSFGPMIKVIGPKKFVGLILERIEKQERLCGL